MFQGHQHQKTAYVLQDNDNNRSLLYRTILRSTVTHYAYEIYASVYLFEFCVHAFIFYFKWMKVMLHKCDTFVLSDTCSLSCHFVMHQICFVIEKCLSADMRWFHLYTAAVEPLWGGIGEYLSWWCAIGTLGMVVFIMFTLNLVQRGCCVLFIFF